jgi:elongation factor Ts
MTMAITAADVKALRDRTGAPMMDCKKALTEVNGDTDEAIKVLRKKGLATAAKRAGRAMADGRIQSLIGEDGRSAVLLEVDCETDFVARGDDFTGYVDTVCKHALACGATDIEALGAQTLASGGTAEETLKDMVGKIGENMALGKLARVTLPEGKPGLIGTYVHSNSKVGVLLVMTADKEPDAEQAAVLAKDLCMQVAAMRPIAVSPDDVPADVLEREKEIFRGQVKGKPENMLDKIVQGKLKKFFQESCLLDQKFVKDDKRSVRQVVADAGKAMGADLTVESFVRFAIGE